ncbi:hypothetical protein [Bacillus massilinigeriensis]|uniref:hypothetical protein n=1 Tax=Bacillus massilionigeriensis TaxID=1805475 RepID=UPI000B0B3A14|nr:hypothetical protein [Bacillus massilionigeriensis]
MKNLIESLVEDVNNEDGVFIQFFTGLTNRMFQAIILLSIPLFIYLFWGLHKIMP